jgi:hypothetical protein
MKQLILFFLLALNLHGATLIVQGPPRKPFSSGSALNDSLIAYWSMEEALGDTRVDSEPTGTPQDLTDVNTVDQTTGILNNGALFKSVNNEVLTHADSTDLSMGDIDMSVVFWAKFTTVAESADMVCHYNATGNNRSWTVRYSASTGKAQFIVSANGIATTTLEAAAFGNLATNRWYFFFASHDSVNNLIKLSVDDTAVVSLAYASGLKDSTSDFRIGSNGLPAFFMDGVIDEVALWKRCLTAAEVTLLYNAGGPFGCCPFP